MYYIAVFFSFFCSKIKYIGVGVFITYSLETDCSRKGKLKRDWLTSP